MIDSRHLLAKAAAHREEMVAFLRELIAIPAPSGQEGERCERVRREFERLGFADVGFDRLGNVLARVGDGPLTILMDGHIDCVGVGDPQAWEHDPFEGKREGGRIYGRGAVDELPAIATMAYGMQLARKQSLLEGVTVWLCASVMEEDCDGYCLLHLIEKEGLAPDAVILGEPTDLAVHRGQRGRLEIEVIAHGVSAHGAHADKGVNAVTKIAPIVLDIADLNARLPEDPFLGAGSITVTEIASVSPSLCAVPDLARIHIDRRLTAGETVEKALAEIRNLPHLGDAEVKVPVYEATSWRGEHAKQESSFPTWLLPREHPLVQAVGEAVESVTRQQPAISRWMFSTNGVATMGRLGIPTVGFAPGREELSHTTGEWVAEDDLVTAAAVYAAMPTHLAARAAELRKDRDG